MVPDELRNCTKNILEMEGFHLILIRQLDFVVSVENLPSYFSADNNVFSPAVTEFSILEGLKCVHGLL